jgi:hypothetical protein
MSLNFQQRKVVHDATKKDFHVPSPSQAAVAPGLAQVSGELSWSLARVSRAASVGPLRDSGSTAPWQHAFFTYALLLFSPRQQTYPSSSCKRETILR